MNAVLRDNDPPLSFMPLWAQPIKGAGTLRHAVRSRAFDGIPGGGTWNVPPIFDKLVNGRCFLLASCLQ